MQIGTCCFFSTNRAWVSPFQHNETARAGGTMPAYLLSLENRKAVRECLTLEQQVVSVNEFYIMGLLMCFINRYNRFIIVRWNFHRFLNCITLLHPLSFPVTWFAHSDALQITFVKGPVIQWHTHTLGDDGSKGGRRLRKPNRRGQQTKPV